MQPRLRTLTTQGGWSKTPGRECPWRPAMARMDRAPRSLGRAVTCGIPIGISCAGLSSGASL
eukprot:10710077-Heterocapsa_arctica.AAC.1